MGFDVEGARKAGYSDGEIADFLGDEQKFDVQGARKAGYNDTEILGELLTTVGRVPLPEGVKPSNAGGGRGSINPPTPQPGIVDRAVAGIKSLLAPSDPGLNTQNGDGSIFDKPAPPELQNRPAPGGGTAQPGPTIADPTGRAAAEAQAVQDSRAPWAVQAEREAAQRRYEVNRGISNAPVLGEDTGPTVGERVQAALQPKPMQENSLAGVAQSAAASAARSGVEKVQDISVASTRAIYSVPKLLADASQLVTGGATAPISDLFGAMDEAGKKLASQHHQTVQRELDQVMNDPKAGIADVIGVLVRNPGYAAVEALASGGGSVALSVGASRVFSNVAGRFAASRGLSETATRAAQARAAEAGVEAMNIAMNAGGTFAETKGSITDKYTAAAIAGVATKAAGKAFDGGAEGTLVRGGVGDTRVGRAVTGALKEGAQESYEQAGQQLGQAVGEGRPNDIGDAKQIVLGGALGAPLGGAAGAVSRRRDSPAAPVAPAAPATPRVEEMPTTPISPEEIRQRAPAAPVAPAPVVSTPTPGADIGVAAVPQGALAARAEQALKDANVSPENGPAQVVAPSGQGPDSGAPGGVGDVRPATPGGGRVGDDPGGSVAPGAAAQPVASPSAPDLALKKSPIAKYREQAGEIERNAPPPAEGTTRLWRGNRPGEVGKNPQFTNDLAGIALPFREAYKGDLSYVDVPTSDLAKYVQKGAVAENAEFIVPPDVAAKAAVVGAKTKPVEDFLKIDPKKFAPRDPGVEVSDAPVRKGKPKGKPKGFDKSTAEDVKLADPDKIVTPKPSTDGFPTRESAVQFLKDTGLNEKFHVGDPSEDGTVFVIPFPTVAKKPTLQDKRNLDMVEDWLKVAPNSKVRLPKLTLTKIDTIEKSMVASVAEVVHTVFGTRVNLVDNMAERGVNGVAIHGTNDKSKRFSHVFVDAKVPDFVQTIGHEATHVLEKTSPDLYARLQEVIFASRSKVGHTGYLSERMPLYKGRKWRADGKQNITKTMNDEFTADVSGDMWRDPQFWQRVYELDSGSTFRKLMYQFMKALNKVLNVARARRIDVTKLVTDIDQVRETAAQVWAERAQRNAAAPKAAAKGGTVDGVKEQVAPSDELYSNLAQDKAEPYKPTIPALRKEHAALRALLDCLRG